MRTKENTTIYQIYPKSFQDSDGDGIGDIRGIIKRLDYIQSLHVDMIWITPIFESPMNDNGYDVAHYTKINPLFGTMEDFDELLEESTNRGIGIMLDMVFNHTSTQHEWFQKALTGDTEFMDYYIFKEKPTNWKSKFGGSAWEYVPGLDKYYLSLFDTTQADLNWDNPKVRKELQNVVNFWIDKGVKGFRMDVINLVSKPDIYEDDFEGDGRRFYTDGPGIHHYLKELNQETYGKHSDIITVGEMSSTTIEDSIQYSGKETNELSMVFSFHHLKVDYKNNQKWELEPFRPSKLFKLWREWQTQLSQNQGWNALFLNNHDQPRAVERFGDVDNYHYESATMIACATFMMQGTPFIYQGEELGIPNANFTSLNQFEDIESINYIKEHQSTLSNEAMLKVLNCRSRDNGRTPMPWNDKEVNKGFSTKEPWLDFSMSKNLKSAQQSENEESILNFYRKLIKLRNEKEAFQSGKIEFVATQNEDLFSYIRSGENQTYLVINNFTGNDHKYSMKRYPEYKIVMTNGDVDTSTKHEIWLQPYQCVIVELSNKK